MSSAWATLFYGLRFSEEDSEVLMDTFCKVSRTLINLGARCQPVVLHNRKIGLAIKEAIFTASVEEPNLFDLTTQKRLWDSLLSDACDKFGVPFNQEDLGWHLVVSADDA